MGLYRGVKNSLEPHMALEMAVVVMDGYVCMHGGFIYIGAWGLCGIVVGARGG